MSTIKCNKCGIEKEHTAEFFCFRDKTKGIFRKECRDCTCKARKLSRIKNGDKMRADKRAYYLKNKETILNQNHASYIRNREARLKSCYIYRQNNIDKINENKRIRYKNDPIYRLRKNLSTIINKALKIADGSKCNFSILDFLPYTICELKLYLESLWEEWMTWDNHGIYKLGGPKKWHIDHIIPQNSLLYDSLEHPNFLKCWALSNLRPLEAVENIRKSNK